MYFPATVPDTNALNYYEIGLSITRTAWRTSLRAWSNYNTGLHRRREIGATLQSRSQRVSFWVMFCPLMTGCHITISADADIMIRLSWCHKRSIFLKKVRNGLWFDEINHRHPKPWHPLARTPWKFRRETTIDSSLKCDTIPELLYVSGRENDINDGTNQTFLQTSP